jgi:penicillin-insensitive murein endopeptidase
MNFKISHLALCLLFVGCASLITKELSPEFAKWASLKTPSTSEPKIYGSYQMGCLAGAKALPLDGQGYTVVRRSRERYYGHPTLVNYLTELGKKLKQKNTP